MKAHAALWQRQSAPRPREARQSQRRPSPAPLAFQGPPQLLGSARQTSQLGHQLQRHAWRFGGLSSRRSSFEAAGSRLHLTKGRSDCQMLQASQPRQRDTPRKFDAFSYLPDYSAADAGAPQPLPRQVEGVADDPRLANPLERQERLGTGWMGAIVEYEGIAVEDCSDLHTRAWQMLAAEEGKPQPLHWALRRAEGMKNEQVVQEVLLWSRSPMEVRRLCARKEELFRDLRGDVPPALPLGTDSLLGMLARNNVPVALACSAPEARVRPTLDALGLSERLDAVITAEDVARGRPDPEAYLYAAQQLGRPPMRCVLIGNSNASVEAARECGMAVVAVAGRTPVYELTAADLVVRHLDELSFVNLKQLFRGEERVASEMEPELEEEAQAAPAAPVMTMERW